MKDIQALIKEAENGGVSALTELGRRYTGKGGNKIDFKAAKKCWETAAEKGGEKAMYYLNLIHSHKESRIAFEAER